MSKLKYKIISNEEQYYKYCQELDMLLDHYSISDSTQEAFNRPYPLTTGTQVSPMTA